MKIATIHVLTCWAFSGEHIVLFLLKACTCLSVPLLTKVRKRSTTCRAQKSPPPPAPEAAYKAGFGALPSIKINSLRFSFSISRYFSIKKHYALFATFSPIDDFWAIFSNAHCTCQKIKSWSSALVSEIGTDDNEVFSFWRGMRITGFQGERIFQR